MRITPADDWIHCKIADACEAIDYGLTASASALPSRHRFLRITDIANGPLDWSSVPFVEDRFVEDERNLLHHGDVVIARTGASTGASAYISEPPRAVFASYLVRLQTKPQFDSRFLAYYLQSAPFREFLAGVLGDKSAQPNASASTMTSAPFSVPRSKEIQSQIGKVLGAFDEKIELNRRMNQTLEAFGQALFSSWFMDSANIRESVALQDVFEINPPRSLPTANAAPYLDMANVPTRGHTPDEIVMRAPGSGARYINGDTLLARITPCLENGKTAFVDFLAPGQVGWGSTEFTVLRPKCPLPEPLGYFLARSEEFRTFAIQSMIGTSGRQRVSTEALRNYMVSLPTTELTEEFGVYAAAILGRIRAIANENRSLAAIRDALLPKLLMKRR